MIKSIGTSFLRRNRLQRKGLLPGVTKSALQNLNWRVINLKSSDFPLFTCRRQLVCIRLWGCNQWFLLIRNWKKEHLKRIYHSQDKIYYEHRRYGTGSVEWFYGKMLISMGIVVLSLRIFLCVNFVYHCEFYYVRYSGLGFSLSSSIVFFML